MQFITVMVLIFNILEISLIPLPFKAIGIILFFTSGLQAL